MQLIQEPKPTVTIVIPNFNGGAMLKSCLRSVFELSYPRELLQVIVIDNGSTDDSTVRVRQIPDINLVTLRENQGFARAANLGIAKSESEFVALINNDVELETEWLPRLLTPFLQDPTIAAATGKLLFMHSRDIVNDLGDLVLINGSGIHRGLGIRNDDNLASTYVGSASGAACLLRKSAFLASGGFDDSYFAYFEDIDLGWRMWQGGFKIIFDPSAVAYHSWQATSGKFGTRFRTYHCAKNSFATFLKNAQNDMLPEAFLLWFLRLLLEIARSIDRRDPYSVLALVKAIGWCARNLKSILVKRRVVQARRLIADASLIRSGVLGLLREGLGEMLRLHRIPFDLA